MTNHYHNQLHEKWKVAKRNPPPDGIRLEALTDGKQYFVPYHRVLLKARKEG